MTPKTLRRKLQKKVKRRTFGRCPKCNGKTEKRVTWTFDSGCQTPYFIIEECVCKFSRILSWTGIPG